MFIEAPQYIHPPNKSAVCRVGTLGVLCNLISANANQVTMVFGCDCVCKGLHAQMEMELSDGFVSIASEGRLENQMRY